MITVRDALTETFRPTSDVPEPAMEPVHVPTKGASVGSFFVVSFARSSGLALALDFGIGVGLDSSRIGAGKR